MIGANSSKSVVVVQRWSIRADFVPLGDTRFSDGTLRSVVAVKNSRNEALPLLVIREAWISEIGMYHDTSDAIVCKRFWSIRGVKAFPTGAF